MPVPAKAPCALRVLGLGPAARRPESASGDPAQPLLPLEGRRLVVGRQGPSAAAQVRSWRTAETPSRCAGEAGEPDGVPYGGAAWVVVEVGVNGVPIGPGVRDAPDPGGQR